MSRKRKEKKLKEKKTFKEKIYDILIRFFQEEQVVDYKWLLHDGDTYSFMIKRFKKTGYFILFVLISLGIMYLLNYYLKLNIPLMPIGIVSLCLILLVYKADYFKLKMNFSKRRDEVYKSFPLWISTLEILVMSNNIPNTFKKSIETCPKAFRTDLIEFVNKIETDPENKEYYKNFLTKYQIEEVTEIIMDMYSFNKLNKEEIVFEFKHLNERLNKITNNLRVKRQETDLFFISALNSIPVLTVSIYVLIISMTMNM